MNGFKKRFSSFRIEPYAELIKKTASAETDPIAAKLGLLMLWTSDNVLDAVDVDLAPLGISESKLDFYYCLFCVKWKRMGKK